MKSKNGRATGHGKKNHGGVSKGSSRQFGDSQGGGRSKRKPGSPSTTGSSPSSTDMSSGEARNLGFNRKTTRR